MFLAAAALLLICCAARAAEQGAPTVDTAPVATPTLEQPNKPADGGKLIPDNIKTMEDYRKPFVPDRSGGPYRVSVFRVLGSLAIVVAMILALAYGLKMFWSRGMRMDLKGRHIRVLDVMTLGMNRSLFLVSVGKKIVLLGSADKGLAFLMELNGSEDLEEIPGTPAREGGVAFQSELESALTQTETKGPVIPVIPGRAVSFKDKLKSKLKRLDEDRKSD